jgi:hypothetical protein
MSYKYLDASALRGKKIKNISQVGDDRIEIETDDGKRYVMLHDQDCCESVRIHDISGGTLQDLVGFTITAAREITECDPGGKWPDDVKRDEYEDSWTWTTYEFETLATVAPLRIRWLGTSNGYYGEGVQIEEVE